MFGMGFMEIFLILVIAIVALGPEKLPSAAVDTVRFFKKFKASLEDVKTSVNQELHISEMKDEANRFKESVNEIKGISNISLDEITSLDDDVISSKPKEPVISRVEKQSNQADEFQQEISKINEKKIEKPKVSLEKVDLAKEFNQPQESISIKKDEVKNEIKEEKKVTV
ncbi:MAG: Sec-independent protein translocase protein TatB [Campylobacterota bacterium]|nr:Sec-independent protein translocase protein TatB [Campylobacterota bacterium]